MAYHESSDRPAWLALLRAAVQRTDERNSRELFLELNPHLGDDELFLNRYAARKTAAVLIPVIEREEPSVLLTLRSPDTPSHGGQVSFPGGRVQDGDPDLEYTALRETHEEVGIAPDQVNVLGDIGVHIGGQGYKVTPFVGLVHEDTVFTPCPREVDEIFEVPLSFVLDINNHGTEDKTYHGVAYRMFAVSYERYYIWGLTAGILRTLAERVQALTAEA